MARIEWSEEDLRRLLRRLDALDRAVKNARVAQAQRPELGRTPDVYLAWVPSGGIAALTLEAGTGTGTVETDTPAYADCPIFRVIEGGSEVNIEPVGITRRVYNLSTTAVTAFQYVLAVRDKFGTWFAAERQTLATGGGGGSVTFSGARVTGPGATVNTATPGVLDFNAETFDESGFHDNATNNSRLTPPAAGFYLVGYNLRWDGAGGGINFAGTLESRLRVNGSTFIFRALDQAVYDQLGTALIPDIAQGGSMVWEFNGTTDFVEVWVNHTVDNSIDVTDPVFWIAKVGD
jgi:hypothetical protein